MLRPDPRTLAIENDASWKKDAARRGVPILAISRSPYQSRNYSRAFGGEAVGEAIRA